MGAAKVLNSRPFTILGLLTALHTLVYGIGYSVREDGFMSTPLYQSVDKLMEPAHFGWVLTLVGLCSMISWIVNKDWMVIKSTTLQTFTWLFVTALYFVNGYYMLGVGIGFVWTFISFYQGYAFTHRRDIVIAYFEDGS